MKCQYFVQKHAREYQALLQQIADILITGNCWREVENGVEFFDLQSSHDICQNVHHYRSTNQKEEKQFLNDSWQNCLKEEERIPSFKIFKFENNKYCEKIINTLEYFKDQNIINKEIDKSYHTTNNVEELESMDLSGVENLYPSDQKINDIDFSLVGLMTEDKPAASINISGIENLELHNEPILLKDQVEETYPPIVRFENKTTDAKKSEKKDEILTTSTPATIKTKKKMSECIQYFEEVKEKDCPKFSSSSEMLKEVLGNIPLVAAFDKSRKSVKALKSSDNINTYKDCVAKVEVKLLCERERLYTEMGQVERKSLNINTENNTEDNNEDEGKLKDIQRKIKYIRSLRKELKF